MLYFFFTQVFLYEMQKRSNSYFDLMDFCCCFPPLFLTLIISDVITWYTLYVVFIHQHNKLTHIKSEYYVPFVTIMLPFSVLF